MRLSLRWAVSSFWPIFLLLSACDGTSDPDGPLGGAGGESGGGNSEASGGAPQDCSVTHDPSLELGEGEGSEFKPFEDGDVLTLIFGSQAGMETGFSVVGQGVALADVVRIETALMVGEYPVGVATAKGTSLVCVDGVARLDTAILIDVSLHPDIVSVVQLVEQEADLVATFYNSEGAFITDSVRVGLDR